jgi:CRP-like cAMP-binding protein
MEHSAEQSFLATIRSGKSASRYTPKKAIFCQGDLAEAVYYIDKGKVKLGQQYS